MDALMLTPSVPGLAGLAPDAMKGEAGARRTAQAFEAMFINTLVENMYANMPTDGPFSGGPSEGVWRSLLNDAVAKEIARSGNVGIADQVYREILKLQEAAPAAIAP